MQSVDASAAAREALAADGLALLGAMAAAAYFIIGRSARTRVSTPVYGAMVYGAAALCLTAAAWMMGESTAALPAAAWAGILLLGLVPQLAGHTIFNWALARSPATLVSLAVLGEPLGAILLAYVLLGEAPGAGQSAGGVLLLAGLFLAAREAAARS
jgi:drug/metabolite transporter (DMT)-like permease